MGVFGEKVVIVIPTYNEYGNIQGIVDGVSEVLPRAELLFVDDSSPDGTGEKIRELASAHGNISLLQRPAKLGLGSAYLDAFREILTEKSSEIIVMMDGDLSHPISALPAMLPYLETYDLIVGSRYVDGGATKGLSFVRRLLSYFANKYVHFWLGTMVHDMTSGFMVMKADVLSNLNTQQHYSDGYAFSVELKYQINQMGCRVFEYPIVFTERAHGQSKLSFRVFLEAALLPLRIYFRV